MKDLRQKSGKVKASDVGERVVLVAVFGKPPMWFTYAELEHVTNGFAEANFLAEGRFGSVHRGVLPDGQVIAVKQHKLASSQG